MITFIAAAMITTSSPQTPLRDQALLIDLSRRSVNYFWERSHPKTGFTLDRAPNDPQAPQSNPAISSIAATGYALSAYCIGVDHNWLNRDQAKTRTLNTLKSVDTILGGHNGWYYHFVNWETGKREWNSELSSIDSGLLFSGIHMAESYWNDPEITKLSRKIMAKVNWRWFLTDDNDKPNSLTFSMGWSPENGFLKARWDGFYEQMNLVLLALGNSDDMEDEIWTAFRRNRVTNTKYEVLHGGPLFIHQMSQAYFPMKGKRDILGYDYWVAGRNATLANRDYCIQNPNKFNGYSSEIWGLSACDIPNGYGAQGAPGDIADNGTLAPAAAVASVMYTPELSIQSANAYVTQFPKSYGQYGFTTGFDPTKNWYSPDVIGIDIGQMMLAIENHLNGKPHQWMAAHPLVKKGMNRAGFKATEEGDLESRKLKVN